MVLLHYTGGLMSAAALLFGAMAAVGGPERDASYDVVIVGAGVIGLALSRVLAAARCGTEGAKGAVGGDGSGGCASDRLRVCVVEARDEVASSLASGGNSGILHCGFDGKPGSLEARMVAQGHEKWQACRRAATGWEARKKGAWFPRWGPGEAMVVAWDEEQAAKLPAVVARARANGKGASVVSEVLDAKEVAAREPALTRRVVAGVAVKGEFAVDPNEHAVWLAAQAMAVGVIIVKKFQVVKAGRHEGSWTLGARDGRVVSARIVVNCAGLEADTINTIASGKSPFRVIPRKGQFVLLCNSPEAPLRHIVLPVPSRRTKGILLTPTVYSSVLAGPTAEDQVSRDHASMQKRTLDELGQYARDCLAPGVLGHKVGEYAGLRPGTNSDGYKFAIDKSAGWVTVAGVRSTGLSACLALAEHVWTVLRPQAAAMGLGARWGELRDCVDLSRVLMTQYNRTGDAVSVCAQAPGAKAVNATFRINHPLSTLGYAHHKEGVCTSKLRSRL